MSRDILEQPIVTRFIGAATLEATESDRSRTCYQLNQAQYYVQYTRREALAVAFSILIEESGNLPSSISDAFVAMLMLVRQWWKV